MLQNKWNNNKIHWKNTETQWTIKEQSMKFQWKICKRAWRSFRSHANPGNENRANAREELHRLWRALAQYGEGFGEGVKSRGEFNMPSWGLKNSKNLTKSKTIEKLLKKLEKWAKIEPRWPKMGSRWPKRGQEGDKMGQDGPRWGQDYAGWNVRCVPLYRAFYVLRFTL